MKIEATHPTEFEVIITGTKKQIDKLEDDARSDSRWFSRQSETETIMYFDGATRKEAELGATQWCED